MSQISKAGLVQIDSQLEVDDTQDQLLRFCICAAITDYAGLTTIVAIILRTQ